MNHIPKVDLNHFRSTDPAKKKTFVKEIGEAFSEIGFVALKGHYLSEDNVTALCVS